MTADVNATDELSGRSVGEFVLHDRIGAGGFGAVYRAVQQGLDREAVVKVLRGEYRSNDEVVQRFLREASLAARLDHPYVAHIYAFGLEEDGLLWIAMEHVRGRSLDRVLADGGPLPLADLVPFFERLCEVVQAAHDRGIVHRDIKPANVMVLSRVRRLLPKLLDLGIAKLVAGEPPPRREVPVVPAAAAAPGASGLDLDATARWDSPLATTVASPTTDRMRVSASAPIGDTALAPITGGGGRQPVLTRAGDVMGSPPYMAPEQWVNPEAADARTDVYALGVLAFEALTGRCPFEARNYLAMAEAHLKEPVPPLGAGFPPGIDPVIARAMAKRPEDRFASPLEVAAALRAAAGLAAEPAQLPRLPEALRDLWMTSAPHPLATSIAVLDAARNVHQARDALWNASRVAVRYLALVALACRARPGSGGPDAALPVERLRTLRREGLSDQDWLALARELVQPFRDRPGGDLVARLVPLLAPGSEAGDLLAGLLERKMPTEGGARGEGQVRDHVADGLVSLADFLAQATFLLENPIGVPRQGELESWMGMPRPRRPVLLGHRDLAEGEAVLVDQEGRVVVSLHPLVQVARPAPGREEEMFLLDGGSAAGALLVSLPVGYERRDEQIWSWLSERVPGLGGDVASVADSDRPPYRGLSSFTQADADRFFGRERRIESFVNRLRVEPLLAVVGPSGAGKTSFVQAGVVPHLPPGWWAVMARPGRAPIASLEVALRAAGLEFPADLTAALKADPDALGAALRAAGAARGTVVVAVEQFEELFTLCDDPEQQRLFLEGLTGAARNGEDPVRVVLTLRDDFLVRAQSAPALRDRLSQAVEILATPDAAELRRILIEPARRAGYEFDDPALPAEMVEAVQDKPGALALLSFTAASLWEVRDREAHRLTRSGYQGLGGVGGALAQHAEATLATLVREQRRLVREAFRHLITAEGTRAVLSRGDLVQLLDSDEHAEAVLERLVAARLLVTQEGESGEDRIEIAHEALVSAWPRLGEWVRQDAEGARSRDQLRTAARQWDERGRPRGLLMRDEALVDYRRWQAKSPGPLTTLERDFADASLRDEARGRRIRRTSLAVIAALVSAALVLLVWLNERAKQQRLLAEENLLGLYEEQGRQALLARDYFRSLAYLSAARTGGRRGPALRFMLAEALRPLRQRPLVLAHRDAPTWVEFSPDGSRLLTASKTAPTGSVWSTDGRLLHELAGHQDGVLMATFDPAGALVATAGRDSSARIFSAKDGALLVTLPHPRPVVWVAFSPAGDRLATACMDGHLRLYTREGAPVAELAAGAAINHLSWSPSGDRLATAGADGRARVWDAGSRQLVRTLDAPGGGELHRAEFAPAGELLATGSTDGTVRLHPLDGERTTRVLSGHIAVVNDLAFSPDGALVITASADATARLWRVESGELVASLEGHGDAVMSAAFSPDGTRALTGSWDGTARLWDRDGTPLGVLVGHSSLVYRAVFDRSGGRIATVGIDGSARIWSGTMRSTVRFLVGHEGPVRSAVFSSDGRRLLSVAADRTARVWDVASGAELRRIPVSSEVSWGIFLPHDQLGWVEDRRVRITAADGADSGRALEADSALLFAETAPAGDRLLTVSFDRRAIVWDLASGARLAAFDAASARFGQDGRTIPVIGLDGQVEVWDALTGTRRLSIRAHRGPTWYALPCDRGRRFLSMGADGTLRHWDATTGAPLRSVSLKVNYVGFEATADCDFIAAMGDRHLATLLDATTGQAVNYIDSRAAEAFLIILDPQGRRVAAVDGDRIGLWDLELASESPEEIAATTRCAVPFRVVGAAFVAAPPGRSDCVGE